MLLADFIFAGWIVVVLEYLFVTASNNSQWNEVVSRLMGVVCCSPRPRVCRRKCTQEGWKMVVDEGVKREKSTTAEEERKMAIRTDDLSHESLMDLVRFVASDERIDGRAIIRMMTLMRGGGTRERKRRRLNGV